MLKRVLKIAFIILLFSLSNSYAQDDDFSFSSLLQTFKAAPRGFDVAVYKVLQEKPDYKAIIQSIRNGRTDKSKIELEYSGSEALVRPFKSNPYGQYPVSLSNFEDFQGMRKDHIAIDENFIIHYRGKMFIPKGYLFLKFEDVDDLAYVYVYRDLNLRHGPSGKGNDCLSRGPMKNLTRANYVVNEQDLEPSGCFDLDRNSPFIKWEGLFQRTRENLVNYHYFFEDTLVNIEIFFIQEKGDFSLKIKALTEDTEMDDIALQTKMGDLGDMNAWDKFIFAYRFDHYYLEKDDKWKTIDEYSHLMHPPGIGIEDTKDENSEIKGNMFHDLFVDALEDLSEFESSPTDSLKEDSAQNKAQSEMKEQISKRGFRAQISSRLSDVEFPLPEERKEARGRRIRDLGPSGYIPPDYSKEFWDQECDDCRIEDFIVPIINKGMEMFENGYVFGLGEIQLFTSNSLFSNNPGSVEDNRFLFDTWDNFTLDIDLRNLRRMNRDLALFHRFLVESHFYPGLHAFKGYFDWHEGLDKNEIQRENEERDRMISNFSKSSRLAPVFGFEADKNQIIDPKIALQKKQKEMPGKFESFVRRNLYMTIIKFSGTLILPNGFLKMAFLDDTEGAAIVLLNRQKSQFDDLKDLTDNAFIYDIRRMERNSSTYEAKTLDETVDVEIYLFHYSGPLKMRVGIDLDGKGYKDLKDLTDYIIAPEDVGREDKQ